MTRNNSHVNNDKDDAADENDDWGEHCPSCGYRYEKCMCQEGEEDDVEYNVKGRSNSSKLPRNWSKQQSEYNHIDSKRHKQKNRKRHNDKYSNEDEE